MPRLEMSEVQYISLVDRPAVGVEFAVLKRHDPDDEQEQQPAEPAESGATQTDESDTMADSDLEEQVEQQGEQIDEMGDQLDEIQKALADDDGDDDPDAPNEGDEPEGGTAPSAEEIAKAIHEYGDEDDEVEVSEEREKEIKAVVKGMESEGRKGRATQTDGEGESEGFTKSFVADAAAKGGDD